LLDPLSELVKIEPANIGVGLYQHDVKARHLHASLDAVVEGCVNYVGVDVNTASPALLRYVAGLNQAVAKGIIDWRAAKGPFTSREQFREVPGFGDTAFVQAVGFLKISDGINPLDSTRIHPESYQVAERLLEKLDTSSAELVDREKHQKIADAVSNINLNAVADELGVGRLLLADIVEQFVQPGRDPREDLPEPLFKQGVLKFEDLEVGMELRGSVLNVVDFGVFVDIGLHDSGLVHVSQLSSGFIRDPHAAVVVGQAVRVWVLELDKTRRRVALTMIKPGTKPVHGANKGRQQNSKKKSSEGYFQNKPGEPKSLKGGHGRRNSGENERKGRKQFRGPRTYTSRPDRQSKKAITAEMKTGQEPLRTFGDLKQFFNIQTGVDDVMAESSKKKQKKDSERREADSKETVASNADHGDLGSPLPAVSSTGGKEEKSLVAEAVVKPMPDQDTTKFEPDGSAQESSSQVRDSTEVPNEQQSSEGPSEETSQ
jgi:predicted RNA-binding protein with RPS1 domain